MATDPFNARTPLDVGGRTYTMVRLGALADAGIGDPSTLPYSIRVLLESCLRNCDGFIVTEDHVKALANYDATDVGEQEIPFSPGRVVLQDFTGVPAVVDFAALRSQMQRWGGDVSKVNPLIRADLVIDHSVQIDAYGDAQAMAKNVTREFERNTERYRFLKWGQQAFDNFTVVPPSTGIVHQVNLEYLAGAVLEQTDGDETVLLPDSLVGTDSHTTMINGLGVVGWGVGGIEAEASMLGQPIYMLIPEVVGFEITGELVEGTTATDLVLTVTQMLRAHGVVGKFVEFYGSGCNALSLADRATIANMAPEYGATMGFFPIDDRTLDYLRLSGRSDSQIALVEAYTKANHLWRNPSDQITYTSTLSLDLGTVLPSLAGPKRPQDRVLLTDMKGGWHLTMKDFGRDAPNPGVPTSYKGHDFDLKDGAVVIAAITSCTNTSNPDVMVAAGLVARKARERGLTAKPWVKTSLAPGSRVVTDYLDRANLTADLEALGFFNVGYGCTTCIAEGTPVLQSNGTARMIETLPSAGGAVLMSPDGDGTARIAVQRETMPQGERECVQLTLQDGRTLVCTPDHQLLTGDGQWVRADALTGTDRVVVGLEAPLDEVDRREEIFGLAIGDRTLTMKTEPDRLQALAFARLLGHLLADGSISTTGQARMHVGQALDRERVLDDIELLTGKRPAGNAYDERKWTIVLPKELADGIIALPGVTVGPVVDQPAQLPAFLMDDLCPVGVVREFLGGLFGADGHAPLLQCYGDEQQESSLVHPILSQVARPEHVDQLETVFTQLTWLLERCGVNTEGFAIRRYDVRTSESSYVPADGSPRVEVRLQLPDGLSFVQRVGYRYCVDKALRASAATVYWRTVHRIGEQRLWMADRMRAIHQAQPELSFAQARELAANELRAQEAIVFEHYSLLAGHDRFGRLPTRDDRPFRPLHRESCGFPSVVEVLQQLGARDWFAPLARRDEADYAKTYCVDKDATALPTFALGLLDRRDVGARPVFDIAVDEQEAFFAGGFAVHNCIGNSGPLSPPIIESIDKGELLVTSVLSGNRNFEGRVSPQTRGNYLASPPLVVAYAIAGTVDIDLQSDPLGTDGSGNPVYLRDIWPSNLEIEQVVAGAVTREQFVEQYANVFAGPEAWQALDAPTGDVYTFEAASTYIQEPPFFVDMPKEPSPIQPIAGARCIAKLGVSVTTDHISPAGAIPKGSPAARFLTSHGVERAQFNSFGSRRGNDQIMTRGTFGNIRIRNQLAPGTEGGLTTYFGPGETPDGPFPWLHYTSDVDPANGEVVSIYDASVKYQKHQIPLVVLAGGDYGMGSSRDWAAKGTYLLGIRAVIAESYERIHRSNLIGMGVLPLQFKDGQTADSLGLTGHETFDIAVGDDVQPLDDIQVTARKPSGEAIVFTATARIDTPVEVDYYRNGGILHTVLRRLASA